MHTIEKVQAREILDSRGVPTVACDVTLSSGIVGTACVPSGGSTGSKEALELRDGDETRYFGKGVLKAVKHVNTEISQVLVGRDVTLQTELDNMLCNLDGTPNKSRLGANALLSASMAVAKAASMARKMPLYESMHQHENMLMPVPMMNIINGGVHADNNVDIQEFMILPWEASSFAEGLRMGVEVYHSLKAVLNAQHLNTAVGDEGGFAPDLKSNTHAIDVILEAIHQAGFKEGEIALGLDVASSEFYQEGRYHLLSDNRHLNTEEMINFLAILVNQYPIITIEDGLDENDIAGWQQLTSQLGKVVQLVGDDLFVTNPKIFEQGIEDHIANTILIKLNQVGTVSETLSTLGMAEKANYHAVVSHRSGETEDTFIADLAVASGCGQIKTGAPCRSDRVSKYNRLLKIEEEARFPYAGKKAFDLS